MFPIGWGTLGPLGWGTLGLAPREAQPPVGSVGI